MTCITLFQKMINCIYHEEMKILGIDVSICAEKTTDKKKYCKNHNKCKKCGILTGKRNLYYCPMCICPYNECSNKKEDGFDDCNKHICFICKNEKDVSIPYCNKCICPFSQCTNPITKPYKGCIIHSCGNCKELYGLNKKCKSEECCCLVCKNEKVNGVSCYTHSCKICKDLYGLAKEFTIDNYKTVHAITENSHLEIMSYNNDYVKNCPNIKVLECNSSNSSNSRFSKSDKCIGIYPIDNNYNKYVCNKICIFCFDFNKCVKCNSNLKSDNPDILKFGNYCNFCYVAGKCKNCDNIWCHDKYKHFHELCDICNDKVLFCWDCKNVYDINSLEFFEFKYSKDNNYNRCANCIVTKYHSLSYSDNIYRRSAMLVFRLDTCTLYDKIIQNIYCDFNPNKISYDDLFELVLILYSKCNCRKIFMNCLINFLEIKDNKKFKRRILQIKSNDNIAEVMIRCARLPLEIFMIILKKI